MNTVEAFTVLRQHKTHDINRVIFGTAALSKADDPLLLLDEAYARGFRRFDLARTYGAGESERLFGEWMQSRGDSIDRSSLNIITKGGMGKDKYGSPYRPLLTLAGLHEEVDASLASLQVESVEMYMFHRDDPRIPASTFVQWANEIVRDTRKADAWGVSNWSFERFRAAYEYATFNGLQPPVANSPQFSLAVPKCEVWPTTHSVSGPQYEDQIAWYAEHDIELLCWEVLAKGFMAKESLWQEHEVDPDTFYSPTEEGSDEWRLQRIQRAYCNKENYRRRDVAVKLANQCGCKLSQVATMYPLSVGKHVSVIFGTTKVENLDDMVSLENLSLDDEAMYELVGTTRNKKPRVHLKKNIVPFSPPPPAAEAETPVAANNVKKFSRSRGSFPYTKDDMLMADNDNKFVGVPSPTSRNYHAFSHTPFDANNISK